MKKRQPKKQRAAPTQHDPSYHIQNEQRTQAQIIGGSGHVIHQHFSEKKAVQSTSPPQPERVCNIPYPPNPYFTGREELLARLEAMLQTRQPAALSQPQAISGLGGIVRREVT